MVVTLKKEVFWIVMPCSLEEAQRFGKAYLLRFEGQTSCAELSLPPSSSVCFAYNSTLKMEAICSFETHCRLRTIRLYNKEDHISQTLMYLIYVDGFHSWRRTDLKSCSSEVSNRILFP
jgi:hypothetical protein